MIGYHSVHRPPEPAEPRTRWTDGRSHAFVMDITADPLAAEYGSCDVLYADLPWQSGYERYQERAGASDAPPWCDFMRAVSQHLVSWPRPAVMVTGRHARNHLPAATQELPVRMPVAGRQPAVAYVYGMALTADWDGTDQLLARLARMYDRVGDFCAGYGWAPRAFTRAGGTFVASDVNPLCVGYIAEHAPRWAEDRLS